MMVAGAGKYLKPYQGLKLLVALSRKFNYLRRKIPKTLSGIETRYDVSGSVAIVSPENT